MSNTLYDILEVNKTVSDDEVEAAYQRLLKRADEELTVGSVEHENRIKVLEHARDKLSTIEKRHRYAEELKNKIIRKQAPKESLFFSALVEVLFSRKMIFLFAVIAIIVLTLPSKKKPDESASESSQVDHVQMESVVKENTKAIAEKNRNITGQAGVKAAAIFNAQGEASWEDGNISFASAIARWDSLNKELTIGLFPFEVTEEDLGKVTKWKMMFYATVGKPSPDPDRWSDPPYLVIILKLGGEEKEFTLDNIEGYALNVTSWKGAGATTAIFLDKTNAREIITEFQFQPGNMGGLQFSIEETSDRQMLEGFRYNAVVSER